MQSVLYHADCLDGYGAALAAWMLLDGDVRYVPVKYGQPPPEVDLGECITIVDFSYPKDQLIQLVQRCGHVTVLDHHESAARELEPLIGQRGFHIRFDMEQCGATLSWEHFHPNKPTPTLFKYLRDRDLWKFELMYTREVIAGLSSYPREWVMWMAYLHDIDPLIRDGAAIVRAERQMIEAQLKNHTWAQIGGFYVPVVNATVLLSETAHALGEMYPNSPFAAYYHDLTDGMIRWGLRGNGNITVNRIAEQYGGGGHPNAAGFTAPHGRILMHNPHTVLERNAAHERV